LHDAEKIKLLRKIRGAYLGVIALEVIPFPANAYMN